MLKVGTAVMDITPPDNVPMAGYGTRKSGSNGIHDRLSARAIVLENGGKRLGWIIAEVLGFKAEMGARIRALACESASLSPECLMISSTHTHSGPDSNPQPDADADHAAHERYLEELPAKLAACIGEAAASLEGATVRFGRAVETRVEHNRRYHMDDGQVLMDWDNPKAEHVLYRLPVDPGVQVLSFEGEKGLRAVIFQFACHSTVMDSGNLLISADWPGAACRHLQELMAAHEGGGEPWVAFAQGCCGDINPAYPKDTFESVDEKGRMVAETAFRALSRSEPVKGDDLDSVMVPASLPRKEYGLESPPTGEFYDCDVQAFRIGDVAIVGLPGEVFSGIGLNIKAHSEFRGTLVGSYTNDYGLGYVPLSSEYSGGYEPEYSKNAPGADVVLTEAALKALVALDKA